MTSPQRLALTVFGLLLFTYGYFQTGTGPNQNSRYNLVRAIVEEGTLSIDSYHLNTIDKARNGGRYFSDKPPGTALLALPFYAGGFHAAAALRSRDEAATSGVIQGALFRIIQVLCTAVPGALLGALLLLYLLPLVPPRAAVLATATLTLGTGLFPCATMLYGQIHAALLVFAVLFLLSRRSPSPRTFLAAGVLTGAALLTQYTTVPAILLLVAVLFAPQWRSVVRLVPWFAAGAAPLVLVLMLYNAAVTGSCFAVGYAHEAETYFKDTMGGGFFGISLPKPAVVFALLFGGYRGLFLLSPALLAVFLLADRHFRNACAPATAAAPPVTAGGPPGMRQQCYAAPAVIAYFLLLNSGYVFWWGGACTYPRFLQEAMPFFALVLARALAHRSALVRSLMLVLALCSVGNGLLITAVNPQISESVRSPLPQLYAWFVHDSLGMPLWWSCTRNDQPLVMHDGTNLGLLLGLPGKWSLVPLLLVWLAAAVVLRRQTQSASGT